MANDLSDRLGYLGITDDNSPDSLINVIHSDTDKNNHTSASANDLHAKELRRTSLPVDAYRKSKFASWVQYNLPTPPSSRTNSNSSSHCSRFSAQSSSTSDASSLSIPSPTSSPTSTDAPQLPTPITTTMKAIPPRSSSLQSNFYTSASSGTSTSYSEKDKTKHVTPLRSASSSSSSSLSSLSPQKKKKKRLLPLVSRMRLCPSEKCSRNAHNIEPPEPPPQLLMSALHCDHQDTMDKRKSVSSTDLEQQQQRSDQGNGSMTSYSPTPTTSLSSSSFSWFDSNDTQTTTTSDEKSNHLSATIESPSHRVRRRSSCPSKSSNPTTTMQESVMMRSFCSPVNSPMLHSTHMTPLTSTAGASPSLTTSLPHDVYDHHHHHHRHQCLLSFSTMKSRSRPLRRHTSGKHEKKALRVWHDSLVESLKNEQQDDGSIKSTNRSSSTLSFEQQSTLSKEKRERNALTRKFILREFYLTEVTFWNQLYYSKVMFCDPLQESLERQGGAFTRTSDLDLFSNLPDLMQCSSQLIRSMAPYLDHPPSAKTSASTPSTPSTSHQELPSNNNNNSSRSTKSSALDGSSHPPYRHRRHLSQYEGHTSGLHSPSSFSLASPSPSVSTSTTSSRNAAGSNRLPFHLNADARMLPSPNDQLLLGKELCTMANQFVVYLRCALDYKVNRKKLDHRAQHNKGFVMYQEKLASRKETNQFYVHDFLIIPIQRIARYGLLLADLQKHTEKNHPDYYHISRARMILTALAVAMNKAQQ
ncbi:unnamed protein product [Absidia cylindrospora]